MSVGAGWSIGVVGAGMAAAVGFVSLWSAVAVVTAAMFASTFLTKASRSAGISIVFVANVLFTVLIALVIRSQADAAIAESIAQSGESGLLVESVGETASAFTMIVGAAAVSVPTFILSLVGSLLGTAVRPRAR